MLQQQGKRLGTAAAVLALAGVVILLINVRGSERAVSTDCSVSARGIPECGAYVGAAVGGNDDPSVLEHDLGQRLGVRRTYWNTGRTEEAVATARADLHSGRLPWISFKFKASWHDTAGGSADEWVASLAEQLAQLPGPVWVAFHHEPEGDGDVRAWRAMQERLGPILRRGAPNVGFTVILTGWNQLFGPSEYSLDHMWPQTVVDVAGFDIYNMYGAQREGVTITQVSNLREDYFLPLSEWTRERGAAWALAETGITDAAAIDHPDLILNTYKDLVETGGIAMTYFDSEYNSTASWPLATTKKRAQFAEILALGFRLPASP